MQRAGNNVNLDEIVRDSWEELDDLITIPEPSVPKPSVPKLAVLQKKKESPKQSNLSAISSEPIKIIATAPLPQSSSEPEIGRVRILKRNPASQPSSGAATSIPSSSTTIPAKTYEERVAAYNEARMRILGSIDDEVQGQLNDNDRINPQTNPATTS